MVITTYLAHKIISYWLVDTTGYFEYEVELQLNYYVFELCLLPFPII